MKDFTIRYFLEFLGTAWNLQTGFYVLICCLLKPHDRLVINGDKSSKIPLKTFALNDDLFTVEIVQNLRKLTFQNKIKQVKKGMLLLYPNNVQYCYFYVVLTGNI